jgi:hypothetical protein
MQELLLRHDFGLVGLVDQTHIQLVVVMEEPLYD